MDAALGLRTVLAKATALIAALVVISIATSSALIFRHFSILLGVERLKQNIAAAELIINPRSEAYAIRNGKLMLGEHVLNGDYSGVDAVARAFGGVATIFQGDTRIATTVRKEDGTRAIGTKIAPQVADTVLHNGQRYIGDAVAVGITFITVYEPLRDRNGTIIGVFVVAFDKVAFNKTIDDAIRVVILGSLVLILLCAGIGGLLFRRLFAPFKSLKRLMEEARSGHYAQTVPYANRQDEFGELARVILEFNAAMKRQQELRAEAANTERHAAEQQHIDMMTMADEFENSVGRTIEEVGTSADAMRETAETMSATAEQLSTSVGEIGQRIMEASQLAASCSQRAGQAGSTMQQLDAEAGHISTVVQLIDGIARQVNLLSLNAAIEAAHAGNAGRGFAVVAAEVKRLADQTAEATDGIAAQVVRVQEKTRDAVTAAEAIAATIEQMNEISKVISTAVEQQGGAAKELVGNAANIIGITQSATATGESSARMYNAAAKLADEADLLKQAATKFIARVRSA
jgi:methyl-accepting chemotaxis protein